MTIIIGTVVDWQNSPRLFWIPASIDDVTAQDYLNTARREHEHDLMNLGEVNHLVDATGKEELGGGTKVGITVRNRNVQIAFAPDTAPKESGTVTTPDTTGITLIDSTALFQSNGVLPGALLINLTDVSLAAVISVDLETRLICSPLGGGSDNQWDSGDSYVIWNTIQKTVLGGNVVAVDDVGAEMSPIFPTPLTQVIVSRASTGTLQELSLIQRDSFGGGVHLDAVNGVAGTKFPIGTHSDPVNNYTDAMVICMANRFDKFFIHGNWTFEATDNIDDHTIVGEYRIATVITITDGCSTSSTRFEYCAIQGTMSGKATFYRVGVKEVIDFEGVMNTCVITGPITLAGSGTVGILWCVDGYEGFGEPVIDFGGSGRGLNIRGWQGGLRIKNKSGAEDASIGLDGGRLEIAADVTNGTIIVRGVGEISENLGSATVADDGLVNKAVISDAVWDELLATHQTDGTTGRALSLAAAGGDMQNPGAGSVTVYGTITNNQTGIIVDEANIKAIDPITKEILVWNKTNADGYFELFLDPAEYIFEFTKEGYLESETQLTVPDQTTFEIPAITFIPETIGAGTGSETVTEVLVSDTDPIEGARCRAFVDGDMDTIIAQIMTDASGRFTFYLDPETYIIECRYGDSLRYLRVIVELGSTDFTFEDITTDYVPPPPFSPDLGRGTGTEHVSDYVQDTETNRLRYIHVIAKVLGTDEWIAEDWTNENGEFHLYLDVGSYNFFFSGPDFTDISARGDVTSPDTLVWT